MATTKTISKWCQVKQSCVTLYSSVKESLWGAARKSASFFASFLKCCNYQKPVPTQSTGRDSARWRIDTILGWYLRCAQNLEGVTKYTERYNFPQLIHREVTSFNEREFAFTQPDIHVRSFPTKNLKLMRFALCSTSIHFLSVLFETLGGQYDYITLYIIFQDNQPKVIQVGSNMTGTDLCVNKPHCAAAVRPWESEATTSPLPPGRVRTCSVLSGSC